MVGLNSKSMAEHRNPALKSGVSMFIFTNHYRGIYEDLYNKCSKFFKPMDAFRRCLAKSGTDRCITLVSFDSELTLTPGLYKSSGSLEISSGDLTFDAKGDANSVFILQIASTLTTTSGRKVILSGGAQAKNVFWQVGSSVIIGDYTSFNSI